MCLKSSLIQTNEDKMQNRIGNWEGKKTISNLQIYQATNKVSLILQHKWSDIVMSMMIIGPDLEF